ncbi:MAG: hypothetical protein HKN42_03330 [Granulosicoccus sp.]|nr:hypothetical protein [Granulosicoccus sp.]
MMNPTNHTIQPIDVTNALNAILTTDKFAASPQMSAFLRYVVEQTLIGNTRRIKAFTVGIEALGKPASFDPQTDPSVRVLAKRLRSSLDTYYQQNPDTLVFIEMKPGSYVPKFLLRSDMHPEPPATQGRDYSGTDQRQVESVDNGSSPDHGTHLHIDQQDLATQSATTASNGTCEASGTRQSQATTVTANQSPSSISQLWQAYKSASKVA